MPLVLSLSQEEVELPLLLPGELSIPEKLPRPPSPSLLQVAGERLKSRPLRKSMLVVTLCCLSGSHLFRYHFSLVSVILVEPQPLS